MVRGEEEIPDSIFRIFHFVNLFCEKKKIRFISVIPRNFSLFFGGYFGSANECGSGGMLEAEERRITGASQHSCSEISEEELPVLPWRTKVVLTGNDGTKSALVGLQGVFLMENEFSISEVSARLGYNFVDLESICSNCILK